MQGIERVAAMMETGQGAAPSVSDSEKLGVSLHDALTDRGWQDLQDSLLASAGRRPRKDAGRRTAPGGVVIDVSAMDVMDSFATRSLDGIARMLALRGAETVVVGIQPGVAFAMAQLGLGLASAGTALDLEAGLRVLAQRMRVDERHGQ